MWHASWRKLQPLVHSLTAQKSESSPFVFHDREFVRAGERRLKVDTKRSSAGSLVYVFRSLRPRESTSNKAERVG